MSSKTSILNRIRENKPSFDGTIDLSSFLVDEREGTLERFCSSLAANSGKYVLASDEQNLNEVLLEEVTGKSYVDIAGVLEVYQKGNVLDADAKNYKDTKVVIFKAQVGVAENGAVWVDDQMIQGLRILPFIVEHTIVILKQTSIVPTMHHAYQKIGNTETGFGTFLAGPSKTGDIEQNLVIGAHGALSHLVVLV